MAAGGEASASRQARLAASVDRSPAVFDVSSVAIQWPSGSFARRIFGRPNGGKMKVVLFCGGLGIRLREHSDTVPKSFVNVGIRPIIWHLMRFCAHFGHKDFVLCLGYRG